MRQNYNHSKEKQKIAERNEIWPDQKLPATRHLNSPFIIINTNAVKNYETQFKSVTHNTVNIRLNLLKPISYVMHQQA